MIYFWGDGNHCEKQAQGKTSTSAHSSVPKVGLKNKSHQCGVGLSALNMLVICSILFSCGRKDSTLFIYIGIYDDYFLINLSLAEIFQNNFGD